MTPTRTLVPVLAALATALWLPTAGLAQSKIPPDNSGGGAYLPPVSEAAGETPEDDVASRAVGRGVASAAIRRKFERSGADGAAAAALAEATAPEADPGPVGLATVSFEPLALAAAALAAEAASGSGVPPPETEAERSLEIGFVGDQFGGDLLTSGDEALRERWWDRLAATNASIVRINLYWNQVADIAPPADAADPEDPSYDWTIPDAAVREAEERGIEVVFTVLGAPRWAEGADAPPEDSYRVGSWKPDPERFGEFARAAASRYSGEPGELPRVRFWEAWNEPNTPQYLTPQWDGTEPTSPEIYRGLLNSFYAAVKSVDRSNVVIGAATAPFGGEPGGNRMRPYQFWRELLCLTDRELLAVQSGAPCATGAARAHLDLYTHHPINGVAGNGPTSPPPHPDDGVPSNFGELTRIVRQAEASGTILPDGLERPGWATELWYESNPPEPEAVGLGKQARFMEQALRVLWDQGAEAALFLQLRDAPYDPAAPALVGFQTGVYLPDDEPKPSLQAVRFPFVAERVDAAMVRLWGRAPRSGQLTVDQRGAESGELTRFPVRRGRVFETTVELPEAGAARRLRAEVGGVRSLSWSLP